MGGTTDGPRDYCNCCANNQDADRPWNEKQEIKAVVTSKVATCHKYNCVCTVNLQIEGSLSHTEKQELSDIDTITLKSYFLSPERLTTVPGCFVKLIQSSSTEGARIFYVCSFCQQVCEIN